MVVFAATPRSTRTFLSLAAASELKWIRGDDSRSLAHAATPSTQVLRCVVQWPYHRAPGGAPPVAEVMDGKEEVFVVEAQPGSVSAVASLESLDVLDKLPDDVVTPFAMDVMER